MFVQCSSNVFPCSGAFGTYSKFVYGVLVSLGRQTCSHLSISVSGSLVLAICSSLTWYVRPLFICHMTIVRPSHGINQWCSEVAAICVGVINAYVCHRCCEWTWGMLWVCGGRLTCASVWNARLPIQWLKQTIKHWITSSRCSESKIQRLQHHTTLHGWNDINGEFI